MKRSKRRPWRKTPSRSPTKPARVAGTPTLITPVNATPAPGSVASLLRTDTD